MPPTNQPVTPPASEPVPNATAATPPPNIAPATPVPSTPPVKKPSTKLIILAFGLIFLGGPFAALVGTILNSSLGNPPDGSPGRATVNITMFALATLAVLSGIVIGLIIIVRAAKFAKSKPTTL